DVVLTSKSQDDLLLPVVLNLSPQHQYDGAPLGAAGRSSDGTWLVDLSAALPDGVLHPGQSTTGHTITIYNPTRQRVAFDPTVSALSSPVGAPAFTSTPLTTAAAGTAYSYAAQALDPSGESLVYLLYQAPSGMTVDASSGILSWTPGAGSPA